LQEEQIFFLNIIKIPLFSQIPLKSYFKNWYYNNKYKKYTAKICQRSNCAYSLCNENKSLCNSKKPGEQCVVHKSECCPENSHKHSKCYQIEKEIIQHKRQVPVLQKVIKSYDKLTNEEKNELLKSFINKIYYWKETKVSQTTLKGSGEITLNVDFKEF